MQCHFITDQCSGSLSRPNFHCVKGKATQVKSFDDKIHFPSSWDVDLSLMGEQLLTVGGKNPERPSLAALQLLLIRKSCPLPLNTSDATLPIISLFSWENSSCGLNFWVCWNFGNDSSFMPKNTDFGHYLMGDLKTGFKNVSWTWVYFVPNPISPSSSEFVSDKRLLWDPDVDG